MFFFLWKNLTANLACLIFDADLEKLSTKLTIHNSPPPDLPTIIMVGDMS